MTVLGNGLYYGDLYEDAVSVGEAKLSMLRRIGASEGALLTAQGNVASIYNMAGRIEESGRMQRDVYLGYLKLFGEEHRETIREANNYANTLVDLGRFDEAKSVLRKMMPVARRVLGDSKDVTLTMRCAYARALYDDDGATLDDLREAVNMIEELERTARRVLGGAHPLTTIIGLKLQDARATLRARETPSRNA